MKYKELVLTVPISYADVVSLLIVDCGGSSAILDEETAPTGSIVLTTYVPADDNESLEQIKHSLRHLADEQDAFSPWSFTENEACDGQWLYEWQQYFHPTKVTSHLWVTPAWEEAPLEDGDDVIKIEPGLSFGSGLHDTTCMCMEYLSSVVKEGDKVYDIGTGTGILAIAAAKMGATSVTAVDLDKDAVDQAILNVTLNGVDNRVQVFHSDLLQAVQKEDKTAHVIVANLVTDAVLALLPQLADYVHGGTAIIVSGIIDERIDEVRKKAADCQLLWEDDTLRHGWYAALLRCPE